MPARLSAHRPVLDRALRAAAGPPRLACPGRERFIEALRLIVAAWTEPQPFGWMGRYYEYRTISIWPRPVQQPHPEIIMSISSPEMAESAAANRLSAGLAVTTVPRARESVAVYRDAARAQGWEPAPDQILYRAGVHVAATDERIMAAGDLQERIETGQILAGSRATVLRQAAAVGRQLGAGILELAFIAPSPDKRRRSIELFGTEVLPRLREL